MPCKSVFDAQPGTCPTGAVCPNLEGRLAYVKIKLSCDAAGSDDTFDQETYFSYDKAGRRRYETIEDDAGRSDQRDHRSERKLDHRFGKSVHSAIKIGPSE